jgi:NAD(P)-dependent dehydrogenase (short-subunit alcohol dehydrogenase family)
MDRRRALITGAARRLGRAMALDLAGSGWDVGIHYNGSAEAAARTAEEARALGAQAIALQADLLVEAQVETLVARAAEALGGPLSLLINNASIFENDRLDTMTRESWDRGIETNLRAPIKLTQDFAAQAPRAVTDARGEPVAQAVVINMLDMRVLKPLPTFLSYFVAKSGLHAFTRAAAQALGPDVRIAGIGPGPTLAASTQSEEHFARQRAACILGRGSDSEDIVAAMRFILANKAFTGQMLAIDGGQHLSWRGIDAVTIG